MQRYTSYVTPTFTLNFNNVSIIAQLVEASLLSSVQPLNRFAMKMNSEYCRSCSPVAFEEYEDQMLTIYVRQLNDQKAYDLSGSNSSRKPPCIQSAVVS